VLVRSYVYDAEGNLYKVTDHTSGKTYTLSYDLIGRLVHVSDEKGTDFQYISAVRNLTANMPPADGRGAQMENVMQA